VSNNKFCTNCGSVIVPGDRFCTGCGAEVNTKEFCQNCGAEVNAEQAFCTKCGFSDYSAFFRAYKAHFGHCPSEVDSADILTDTRDFIRHYQT